jgi:hypothetical protein
MFASFVNPIWKNNSTIGRTEIVFLNWKEYFFLCENQRCACFKYSHAIAPQKSFHSKKQTNSVANSYGCSREYEKCILEKKYTNLFLGRCVVLTKLNWLQSPCRVILPAVFAPAVFKTCSLFCTVHEMIASGVMVAWPASSTVDLQASPLLFQPGLDHHMKGSLTAELLNGRLAPENQGPNHPEMV